MMWFATVFTLGIAILGGVVHFTSATQGYLDQHGDMQDRNQASLQESNAVELFCAETIDYMRNSQQESDPRKLRENFPTSLSTEHSILKVPGMNLVGITAQSDTRASTHFLDAEIALKNERGIASISNNTKRLNMGHKTVFDNALTVNEAQCMACHMTIFGDVAEYGRTGLTYRNWDRVHGTWHALEDNHSGSEWIINASTTNRNVPTLPTFDTQVVPDLFHHFSPASDSDPWSLIAEDSYLVVRDLKLNYQGPKIPWNPIRQEHILPKFDPSSMLYLATGTLLVDDAVNAYKMIEIPYGSTYASTPSSSREKILETGIVEGNLIVRGTPEHPIQIRGKVFVRGDLIIGGTVSGQGSLYAGRNIYIVDNLQYNNPPPGLDGSQASNRELTLVSYCHKEGSPNIPCDCENPVNCVPVSNAKKLKDEWEPGNYDQLMLVATNNIVIGDPFPEPVEFAPGKPLNPSWNFSYAVRAILANHIGEFATDLTHGYLLDREPENPSNYLYPWGRKGSRVPAHRESPPIFTYNGAGDDRLPDGIAGDRAFKEDDRQYAQSPAFQELFLPKNTALDTNTGSWELKDWITASEFRSGISGSPSLIKAASKDRYGRRGRIKNVLFPGALEYPLTPQRWQTGTQAVVSGRTEGITKTLDRLTGLIAEAKEGNGSFQTVYQSDVDFTQSPGLAQSISGFFFQIRQSMLMTGAGSPDLNRESDDIRFTANGTDVWATFATYKFDSQYCWTTASPDHLCDCSAPGAICGRAYTEVHFVDANYDNARLFCSDNNRTWAPNYRGNNFPTPRCNSGLTANDVDERVVARANDLRIQVFSYRPEDEPMDTRMQVDSRYWNASRLVPRPRIQSIDSFLFANHYLFLASDATYGNDLKIRGGVVAKDFAGFFGNYLDPAMEKTPLPTAFTSGNRLITEPPPPVATESGWATGLTIMLDPRAQFETDFLYPDFCAPMPKP